MIFGIHNYEYITWLKIGEIDGNPLYLSKTILSESEGGFGETDSYLSSVVRKKCLEVYNKCFFNEDRTLIVKHPRLGDPVFLLSKAEYLKYKDAINSVESRWWLRSPGVLPTLAPGVGVGGGVYDYIVDYTHLGLRPAILLKKEGI